MNEAVLDAIGRAHLQASQLDRRRIFDDAFPQPLGDHDEGRGFLSRALRNAWAQFIQWLRAARDGLGGPAQRLPVTPFYLEHDLTFVPDGATTGATTRPRLRLALSAVDRDFVIVADTRAIYMRTTGEVIYPPESAGTFAQASDHELGPVYAGDATYRSAPRFHPYGGYRQTAVAPQQLNNQQP